MTRTKRRTMAFGRPFTLKSIGHQLPPGEIELVTAAGPILIEWKREREEQARKRQGEEERRQDRRRGPKSQPAVASPASFDAANQRVIATFPIP
jgi:hypothetical protein